MENKSFYRSVFNEKFDKGENEGVQISSRATHEIWVN